MATASEGGLSGVAGGILCRSRLQYNPVREQAEPKDGLARGEESLLAVDRWLHSNRLLFAPDAGNQMR